MEAEEVTEEETETKEILRTENFVKATEAWTAEVTVKTVVANVMVIVVNFVAVINSKMASKKTKETKKKNLHMITTHQHTKWHFELLYRICNTYLSRRKRERRLPPHTTIYLSIFFLFLFWTFFSISREKKPIH